MKNVFVVSSNNGGVYGVYSTKEKAEVAAKEYKHNLLAGGWSFAQTEVLEMEVKH